MKEVYLAVTGRIRRELQELAQIVERTMRIWQKATLSNDDYYVDATALNLHSFYAGLERVFEVIADGIDRVKPAGVNWHQELLHQMAAEIPSVRPPVLSPEVRDKLDRYRGFRHVVRKDTYSSEAELDLILGKLNVLPHGPVSAEEVLAIIAAEAVD